MYGERTRGGYRVWDPRRSKFSALAHLDPTFDLAPGTRVLYLGAANGTTVSHVADYAEVVYAVEFAPRPMQDLLASIEEIPARFRESVAHMEVDSSALSGAPDLCLDNSIRGRFCKHLLDRIEASAESDTTRLLRRALDLGLSALSDG